MSETEHPTADCTCPFCDAMRVAQGAYENMDAYAKRLRGERDAARQQLEGAVADNERMRLALRALLDTHAGCECGVCVDAEQALPAHTTGGQ
jgi:hypothetical protein